MQVRDHFMNLIVYTAIICIFFLGYFDRTYIRAVLVMISVGILLDLAWLIFMAPVFVASIIDLLVPIKLFTVLDHTRRFFDSCIHSDCSLDARKGI